MVTTNYSVFHLNTTDNQNSTEAMLNSEVETLRFYFLLGIGVLGIICVILLSLIAALFVWMEKLSKRYKQVKHLANFTIKRPKLIAPNYKEPHLPFTFSYENERVGKDIIPNFLCGSQTIVPGYRHRNWRTHSEGNLLKTGPYNSTRYLSDNFKRNPLYHNGSKEDAFY